MQAFGDSGAERTECGLDLDVENRVRACCACCHSLSEEGSSRTRDWTCLTGNEGLRGSGGLLPPERITVNTLG